MNLLGALIGGIIGGLIGGAVWAGVSYGTGYQIGWIAWGLGFLVGLGVAMGSKGSAGTAGGVLAAIIAIASIAGAKFAVVELLMHKHFDSQFHVSDSSFPAADDTEYWIAFIADEIADEQFEAGKEIKWPGGARPDQPQHESEFPKDIWASAKKRWTVLSPDEHVSFRQSQVASIIGALASTRSQVRSEAFQKSFSAFSVIFGLLAIGTAFRVGSAQPDSAQT